MKLFLVVAALLVFTPAFASARCLQFEPTVVLLKGTFVSKFLPGAPGYVSISGGDLPEKVLFLQLDEEICVKGNPNSTANSRTRTGLKEIQLVVPVGEYLKLLDKKVRAYGTLFTAGMRSHRTKVVMTVQSISENNSAD
ncbi:MAG: hypothetical protein ACI91F_003354 [Candidatus Binatia bacterium]|jgi:hypothetical protein